MVANKRKILVTGATGQQGGALARLLLQKKHEVYALIRNTDQESPKAQNLRNLGANLIKGDLDNPDSLEQTTNGTCFTTLVIFQLQVLCSGTAGIWY